MLIAHLVARPLAWLTLMALPPSFVYLDQVAPSIEQAMRYAGAQNFTGAPVPGYTAPRCILTAVTAQALAAAQRELNVFGLGLRVYDCYRPQRAVDHFARWVQRPGTAATERTYFPGIDKSRVHASGYLAHHSGHSRGSTVDLTLVAWPAPAPTLAQGPTDGHCALPACQRQHDGSIDMGTAFDCFDPKAHTENATIASEARVMRLLLRQVMRRYGMINYRKEWWHFSFYAEPHKTTYFDFEVR
jgi:D-alanyl-D-alanine dipeptidase